MTTPTIASGTGAWTPGPWLHNPYDDWRDICQRAGPNSCHVIATVGYSVDGEGDETDRANARLIAAAPEMHEALEAANALIEAMQHQMRQYVEPGGYTAFDRNRIAFADDGEARDSLFVEDMIYLLDGPEQREAQAKIDATFAKAKAEGRNP